MQPVSQHVLSKHLQSLRQIFGRRLESRHGDQIILKASNVAGPGVSFALQDSASTISVINDRDANEVSGILAAVGENRILCSFYESWRIMRPKKPEYRFDKVGMTFFLTVAEGNEFLSKQIFRLEWDNWRHQEPPNQAAYPHWQFDRWLTGSDDRGLVELRESFERPRIDSVVFESAEQAIERPMRLGRPDLSWFTRLHFPSIAPWATNPITNLDDTSKQPHRTVPNSIKELEGWIESSLQYVKNELESMIV